VKNVIRRPWYTDNLLKTDNLTGHVFLGENLAHEFVIHGVDGDGQKVAITGTITASVLRADGGTVWLNGGSIVDGEAHITLTQQCYTVPGQIIISIYSASGNVLTCIYCGVGNCNRSRSDTSVDPGTIMPSVADLIAHIDAVRAGIPADYSSLATQVSSQGGSINTLNSRAAQHESDISALQSDVAVIGDLANLVTPTKRSLVEAINEAYLYDPTAAYDTELSGTSENAVQNKAIKRALDGKMNSPVTGGEQGQCLMSDGAGSLIWGTPTEVSVILGALAQKDRVQATYTPAGSVAAPAITVTPTTATVYTAGSASGGGQVVPGSAAECTLPTLTANYDAQTKKLTLAWTAGSFVSNTPTGVTLPTFTSKKLLTGATATASAPAFTGTEATIVST